MSKVSISYGGNPYCTVDFTRAKFLDECPAWWQKFVDTLEKPRDDNHSIVLINRALRKYKAWVHEDPKTGDISWVYFKTEAGVVQFMLAYS